MKDNSIPIDHLKKADLTNQNVADLVLVLQYAVNHLLLPPDATKALERLQRLINK
jgi:hypothetical protein